MKDIVYRTNADGSDHDSLELRYSLRSICKNVPHRNVYLIGYKPDWVTNVVHVPFPNSPKGKWWNLMEKWAHIPLLEDVSEVVYVFDDDMFITEPFDDIPNYYTNTLEERANQLLEQRGGASVYMALHKATDMLLKDLGCERRNNHELHIPQPAIVEEIPVDLLNRSPVMLTAPSLAANLQSLESIQIPKDYKPATVEQLQEWQDENYGFLSSSEATFKLTGMDMLLEAIFPDSCRYER